MPLEPGLAGYAELTVAAEDTAEALRSSDVPLLGTPRVVALCEEATVGAIDGHLEADMTSVGMRVQLDHLMPVPIGKKVRADAHLDRIQGRRLTFTVSMTNENGLIAIGKITRVLVHRERFLDKAQ